MRVIDGVDQTGMRVRLMNTDKEYQVDALGVLTPKPREIDELGAGEVGFFTASDKDRRRRGDRRHRDGGRAPDRDAFPRLQAHQADGLRGPLPDRVEPATKSCATRSTSCRLNDSSFFYEPEASAALGFGFRCGFLGLLHMEIVQERLEREFDLELITTAPNVRYRVTTTAGEVLEIDSPSKLPDPGKIEKIEEPYHPRDDHEHRRVRRAAVRPARREARRRSSASNTPRPSACC